MFDISLGEIALALIIAIVAIGPKELPTVLRALGRWLSQWRGLMHELRDGFDELTGELSLDDSAPKHIRGDDGQMYEAYDVSELEDLRAGKIEKEPPKKKETPHD